MLFQLVQCCLLGTGPMYMVKLASGPIVMVAPGYMVSS